MSTTTTTPNILVKKQRASKKTINKEKVEVVKDVENTKKGGKKAKKEVVKEELFEKEVVEPVVDVTTKKRASKKVAEEVEKKLTSSDEEVVEKSPPSGKRTVSRESVMVDFDSLIVDINSLIESVREDCKKGGCGIQALRGLNARIKTLQKHTCRIAKGKKVKKATCANSGFNKPVTVSQEMKNFAGWDTSCDVLHSRNDVTKYICNYVKENDLQYPKNRQKIMIDNKLKELLDTDEDMVTYSGIQTCIKHHYTTNTA
jgi:chromatin remodeling complex protein RSC6